VAMVAEAAVAVHAGPSTTTMETIILKSKGLCQIRLRRPYPV
jgi:hypothetical protein